jgi:NAD-dependent SIR2 family protein deacetylase
LFDHEKTAFSLKGAHEQVVCSACHKNLREVDAKQVLFYLPTPKECSACHGAEVSELRISPELRTSFTWSGYARFDGTQSTVSEAATSLTGTRLDPYYVARQAPHRPQPAH